MRIAFSYSIRLIIIILLTILTQIGGIIYLFTLLLGWKLKVRRGSKVAIFITLYCCVTFVVVPRVAKQFGRERLVECQNGIYAHWYTALMNRNYVVPTMNRYLSEVATLLSEKDSAISMLYLDGGFPFCNGFPLLPHLSHNDGRKLDLALVYEDRHGDIICKTKSNSGYGVFEEPMNGEIDQTTRCKKTGHVRYDYSRYFSFGKINDNLLFSAKGNRTLIECLISVPNLQKLFIEPHLKQRVGLVHPKIRFHGCRAVRHDDHIHIQVK